MNGCKAGWLRVLALFATTLIITATVVGTASGATMITRIPLTGLYSNSCAGGELIELEGFVQETSSVSFDASGGIHVHLITNGQNLRAVGVTTGDRYRVIQSSHYSSYVPVLPVFASTFTQTFLLVGAGSADNFSIVITMRYAIDENGVVTTTVSNVRIECRG